MNLARTHALGMLVAALAAAGLAVAGPAEAAEPRTTTLRDVTELVGARDFWRAGYTGKGIDVAVVDTGVADVPGLSGPDKLLHGVDVSFDSSFLDWSQRDGYGHGTHMAGIVAGRDAPGTPDQYAADTTSFLGMAPDARVISVKAGDAAGGVDVTQVIAAIDWVVEHRKDPGLNIRVLNLAYASAGEQSASQDPLAHAVEQAWKAGIVVVVSSGNSGDLATRSGDGKGMMLPARDPFVIAVGASDTKGTASYGDDAVAGFSNPGDGTSGEKRNPDLVAPGRSIAGLRVPGSFIDVASGATGIVDDRTFRGSGTSQAAAVVSGAAALILQQRPTATPDQVKHLLMTTSTPLAGATSQYQGSGQINLRRVLPAATPAFAQVYTLSKGDGGLDGSRGPVFLTLDGVELKGDVDMAGAPLKTLDLATARKKGDAWVDGRWFGRDLAPAGATATADLWSGRTWSGRTWSGAFWTGRTWSGRTWSSLAWEGGSWTGRTWSGRTWSGRTWSSLGTVDQTFAAARWE